MRDIQILVSRLLPTDQYTLPTRAGVLHHLEVLASAKEDAVFKPGPLNLKSNTKQDLRAQQCRQGQGQGGGLASRWGRTCTLSYESILPRLPSCVCTGVSI